MTNYSTYSKKICFSMHPYPAVCMFHDNDNKIIMPEMICGQLQNVIKSHVLFLMQTQEIYPHCMHSTSIVEFP